MLQDNTQYRRFCRNLTAALVQCEWTDARLRKQFQRAAGKNLRWRKKLLDNLLAKFSVTPTLDVLFKYLLNSEVIEKAWLKGRRRNGTPLAICTYFFLPEVMQTPTAPLARPVPSIESEARLAEWLGIPTARLTWYADLKSLNTTAEEKLQHYMPHWLPKRSPREYRLVEEPKPVLKTIQRKILHEILDCLNPHNAAHGFVDGRSIATNAAVHCGRAVVMKFDIKDFFPSIPAAKVAAVFTAMGYPPNIALLLAGLCTTRLPRKVWENRPGEWREKDHSKWLKLAEPHLPQGAPTSPMLANLCVWRLDCRLSALAKELDADYTRYADDLTFSGGQTLTATSFRNLVFAICADEGLTLNTKKTRVFRQCERQIVAGVVVNIRPNISRDDYDELKAIVNNCKKLGPKSQNRNGRPDFRAYLNGRIAHVANINPVKGRRLCKDFDLVKWEE